MRHFDNWINAYLEHTEISEAPQSMHFWTAVSVIAGALRRRVWIDNKIFQWTPNFYIMFVSPPGIVNKSTTADIGMRLLRRVPGINFGPQSMTWQALTQSMGESTEIVQMPGQDDLVMSCVTIVASELGSLLDPKDSTMIDILVDLWDGKLDTWRKSTKTQGDDTITNPWINMIACTTPAWIAGNFPEYMIGGGFTSRTIFIYRDAKRYLRAYPADHIKDNFASMEKKLVDDLLLIADMKGEMTLTPEAKEWGQVWYEEHHNSCPPELASHRFGGYRARKQGQIHKLAMIMSAALTSKLVITQPILEGAAGIITSLEPDLPKVFAWIGATEAADTSNDLITRVKLAGKITQANLYRSVMRIYSYDEFIKALQGVIDAEIIVRDIKGKARWLTMSADLDQ